MIKSFEEYIKSLNFNYIKESKNTSSSEKKKGCNLVFVTKNPTSENSKGEFSRFKKSADKYGVNIYPVDVDKISYKLNDDGTLDIKDIGVFEKQNTLFMFRHAVKIKSTDEEKKITQTNVKNFKKLLKSNGFLISNDASVANICKSKSKTFDVLSDNKVSTIDTIEIDKHLFNTKKLENIDNMNKFISKYHLQLPIVLKVNDGTQGCGIFKCEDINIVTALTEYLIKTKGKCLIQPFCHIDYDVRAHVFCKTLRPDTATIDDYVVVASMKRESKNDFRTNYSLGGSIDKYTLSKEEKQLAKEAAKAIGAVWCGVDICHDNISEKYLVIEINSSPSLSGITSISEKAPTDIMMKYIKKTLSNSEHDDEKEKEERELVGYYETIELDGIPITANNDTGNSAIPALKSNLFEIKDDKVTFEIMGQEVTKKIVRMKSILHGGVKSDPRPVVKFDITYNGKTLKDVEVCVRGLTEAEKEREKKTGKKVGGKRILLSTDIIDKLGLIVHPDRNKKFIKTEKPKKMKD